MEYRFVDSEQIKRLEAKYLVSESHENRRQLAAALAENATQEFEHARSSFAAKEMRERLAALYDESDGDPAIRTDYARTLTAEICHDFDRNPSTNPLPPSNQRQRVADLLDLVEESANERVTDLLDPVDTPTDEQIRELATEAVDAIIEDYRLPELSNNRLRVAVDDLNATIDLFERIVELRIAGGSMYRDVDSNAALSEMRSHRETAKRDAKRVALKSTVFKYGAFVSIIVLPVLAHHLVIMDVTGHGPIEIQRNYSTFNHIPEYRLGEFAAIATLAAQYALIRAYLWVERMDKLDRQRNQYR